MTTPLPTTRLGWTGMDLTRVGFGAWAIGGAGWAYAGAARTTSRRSRRFATRWSPESTGSTPPPFTGSDTPKRWWRPRWPGCPRRTGPTSSPRAVWSGIGPTGPRLPAGSARPASLRREVEASLRRLRVERIDLYQLHWPAEDGTPLEEYWEVFADLKREGKIRAVGLSNHASAAGGGRADRPRGRHPAAVRPDQPRRRRRVRRGPASTKPE